jgi:predicted dienelactone hydrolase
MPTHDDSLRLRGDHKRIDSVRRQQIIGEALLDPKNWQERPRDITFLLDSLAGLERQAPELAGTMDVRRIGVAGHSLGSHTAQLLGGAAINLPNVGRRCSFRDTRVRAVLALSSSGVGILGLRQDSWKGIRLPMMVTSGSLDGGPGGQSPKWRMHAFRRSPRGDKYHLIIEGANHGSFVGRLADGTACENGSQRNSVFEHVKTASLAFWDAYLKQDQPALQFLRSGEFAATSNKAITLYQR